MIKVIQVKLGDSSVVSWEGEKYTWEVEDDGLLSIYDDEAESLVAQYSGWLAVVKAV